MFPVIGANWTVILPCLPSVPLPEIGVAIDLFNFLCGLFPVKLNFELRKTLDVWGNPTGYGVLYVQQCAGAVPLPYYPRVANCYQS
jgi:hypothetical protein